jgi:DNA ligase (NAD+)
MYVYDAYGETSASSYPTQGQMLSYLQLLGLPINPSLAIIVSDKISPTIPSFGTVLNVSQLSSHLEALHNKRDSLLHEIDGMVIKVNELYEREALGYTNHHPKGALAYKFDSPQGETIVTSIDIQVGRTGRITPVARVVPVKVAGSTISNITLHNQDYINLLELAIGDSVAISKRGDVIPAVERVIDKNIEGNRTYKLPKVCPSCNGELIYSGAHQFCTNRLCKDQVIGRISFFVGKGQMDIENFGPETVTYLFEKGLLEDIPDLYTIDYSSLIGETGFGEKKALLLEQGVKESKNRPYQTVLVSLGLPDLGKKGVQLLIDGGIKDIDTLLHYAQEDNLEPLIEIKGIGEKSARTLFAALTDPYMVHLIEQLKLAGLHFETEEESSAKALPQIFENQTWVITGSFANFAPRSLAEKELVLRGAKVTSAISKSTTYLLAGENGGSKINKAKNLGVPIINEEAFIDMLQGEMSE